jgi:hypothetical protein
MQVTKTKRMVLEKGYYLLELVSLEESDVVFNNKPTTQYVWKFNIISNDPAITGQQQTGFSPTKIFSGSKSDNWFTAINDGKPLEVGVTIETNDFLGKQVYGLIDKIPDTKHQGEFVNKLVELVAELPKVNAPAKKPIPESVSVPQMKVPTAVPQPKDDLDKFPAPSIDDDLPF